MAEPLASFRAAIAARYSIERELGMGGMAVVYLARDLKHDRRVALKVLRPEIAVGVGAERFVLEIQVAARLQHPHILALFDSGVAADLPYYVTPYVEGESLRSRLRRERQLGLEETIAIARQVASALDYAHAQGVVHRDVKPDNILFTGGEAVVSDFGIALALAMAGGDKLTQSGQLVGTPAYMSPEQAAGGEGVDGRADIYSLACVVYEMLAGEPPFSSPTPRATIARHLHDTPPSLTVLRPTVSLVIRDAVAKALSKVPADRYRTAGDFVEALAAAPPRARRSPWRVAAVVAGVAAVAVFGGIVGRQYLGRNALEDGLAAFRRWDVREASLLFERAVRADPRRADAQYYFAQSEELLGRPASEWKAAAMLAARGAGGLADWRDSARAIALRALAEGRYPDACTQYRTVLARDSADVLSWFGLGECQRLDSAVVKVRMSPSLWYFRGSYQGAVTAYLQALAWAPRLGGAFGPSAYDRLSKMLMADPQLVRVGEGLPPDSTLFWAWPGLDHDTLILLPTPRPEEIFDPPRHAQAVARGRELLEEVARRWVDADPNSAAAHAQLARALEERGELNEGSAGTAVSELDKAIRLARLPRERISFVIARIRVDLKLGDFASARGRADSLLQGAAADRTTAYDLACASALVGRAHLAANLAAMTASDSSFTPRYKVRGVPAGVAPPALRLVVYSAFGAPRDSLETLAQQVDLQVTRWVLPSEQDGVLRGALEPSANLAFSTGALRRWMEYAPHISVLDVQWLLARGDTARARRRLQETRDSERAFDVGSFLPTLVYEEAWLATAMHDTAGADWLLGRFLDNLPAASWRIVSEPQQAAMLVRAMALRAQLAAARHDPATARRWAAAVEALWSGTELPELRALRDTLHAF